MLISLLVAFLSLVNASSSFAKSGNDVFDYYINEQSEYFTDCGQNISQPCRQINNVFYLIIKNNQYNLHIFEGQYDYNLSYHEFFQYSSYPTVDIVAEEDAQINLTGQIQPIGKIIISFINFSIDFGDLFFQIDDSESSLTISYCNIIRDAGNKAVNSHPLVIVNLGSLILNNLNIIGNNLEGSESLIQSSSPKLIQLTSLKVNNLAFTSESNQPLLLSATYDQTNSVKNEEHSIQPIILIENSEIIHNKLAPFLEASTVYLIGFTPQQILISNCTIDNRAPPNINKTYEFKIVLPLGSLSKDIISQFQTIDFGITLYPVAVKIYPNDQFSSIAVLLTEQYANILVRSNGLESCTNYIANFRRDINTLSCVMIIIRSQESQGLLKGIARSISISGSFVENDLQTDGLDLSFTGANVQTLSNKIYFQPILPISSNLNDNALFRVREDGFVKLVNLYIQRSETFGSENAPVAMIISGTKEWNNEIGKNSPGQLVIDNCVIEGGNSAFSNVWYNLGLAETCNIGYGTAIIADGQTIIQITRSSIRTFEGPAVRALNGASASIDKNTILQNNGQRNRNTLSSMQTNIVCEGGSGTTAIDVALDNIRSFTSTGNGWIFSSSESSCIVKATFNDLQALPRSLPQTNSANVVVNNSNQQTEVTVGGKFLEPCMRRLVLELHETNKADTAVIQEFDIESTTFTTKWINSENIVFQITSSQMKDLDVSVEWKVSIYEYGKREQASWVTALPTQIGLIPDQPQVTKEKPSKIYLIISIVVPIVVVIIAVIIILIIIAVYYKNQDKGEQSYQYHKERNNNVADIEITSKNEAENNEDQEQTIQNILRQRNIQEFQTQQFIDPDTEQRNSSDHNILGDQTTEQKQIQSISQESQKDIDQESASQDSFSSQLHFSQSTDSNSSKKDHEMLKVEMNKKTKKQINKSEDENKSSKQRKEKRNKLRHGKDKEIRRQSRKTSKGKEKTDSSISDLLPGSQTSRSTIDSDSYSLNSNINSQKSPQSTTTQDRNEPQEMIDLKNKKEQLKLQSTNTSTNNKKTSKIDDQNGKDKMQTEDNYYEEEPTPQSPDSDDESSLSSSSGSEDNVHEQNTSQQNKKEAKTQSSEQNSSMKEDENNSQRSTSLTSKSTKSENNKKEDIAKISSIIKLNQKETEISSESLPPSVDDMKQVAAFNIPEKYL